jgi:hypothetical protein
MRELSGHNETSATPYYVDGGASMVVPAGSGVVPAESEITSPLTYEADADANAVREHVAQAAGASGMRDTVQVAEGTAETAAPAEVPAWHMALADPASLIDLPTLPAAFSTGAEGDLLVIERITDSTGPLRVARSKRYQYDPQPASETWTAAVQQTSEHLGMTAGELAGASMNAEAIQADTTIPFGIRQRLVHASGEIPVSRLLHEAQAYAADDAYVQVVAARGRDLLRTYVPDALPQEPTLVAAERGTSDAGSYAGKFGGNHLIALSPRDGQTPIRRADIDAAGTDTEQAITMAHELAHQRHAEMQGRTTVVVGEGPDAAAFDTHPTADAYEALHMADSHSRAHNEQATPEHELAAAVADNLQELYAYTVEEELRTRMGVSTLVNGNSATIDPTHYAKTVLHFLRPNDLSRREVMERVLQVDIAGLPNVPAEQLQAALDDPRLLLELPKYKPAEAA